MGSLNGYSSSFFDLGFFPSSAGWRSHFKGMFWLVPSGKDRRILIGRTPSSNSSRATSIGDSNPCFKSRRTGAPIDIWRALAPTTLAFSKRVSFGGPISMLSGSLVIATSLVVTLVFSLRAALTAGTRLSCSDHVVDL